MSQPQTFSEVIALWPSRADLADDVGVPYGSVKQWDRRDRIPSEHWNRLLAAARKRGITGLSPELLLVIAEERSAA